MTEAGRSEEREREPAGEGRRHFAGRIAGIPLIAAATSIALALLYAAGAMPASATVVALALTAVVGAFLAGRVYPEEQAELVS